MKKTMKKLASVFALAASVLFANSATAAYGPDDVASIGDTGFPTVAAAVNAAQKGETIVLLKGCNSGSTMPTVELTLDLAGCVLTNDANITVAADLTITNSVATSGGLVGLSVITVNSDKTLDMSTLTWGVGGFTPSQSGTLEIQANGLVKMGTTDGKSPNWMVANNGAFLQNSATGAKLQIGENLYTKAGGGIWHIEGAAAKATVTGKNQDGDDMDYIETFTSVKDAAMAAKDSLAILVADCNSGSEMPSKAAKVDLNGFTLTNNEAITVSYDLAITNSVADHGGLVGLEKITVNDNATLDMSTLTWGVGGFSPGQSGSLAITAGATVKMGTTDGMTPNWMAKKNPNFLADCVEGAKLVIGGVNYTRDANGLWRLDGAVAKTEITVNDQTFEESYTTLAAAIDAAATAPVVLLENITLTEKNYLAITKTVTVDLNGHNIERQDSSAATLHYFFKVGNNEKALSGNLTIKDSVGGGKLYGSKNWSRSAIRVESGEFTLESGIIVNNLFANNKDKFNPPCGGAIFVCAGAKATIKDGAIVADNTAGGNTISGVTYDGFGGVFGVEGTLVIEGGTFTNNWAKTDGGVIYGFGNAEICINGGTFTGNTISNGTDEVKSIIALDGAAKCAISNGWFDVNPIAWAAEGRGVIWDETKQLWTMSDAVARIGDRSYGTIAAAVEDVKEGETITLVANCNSGNKMPTVAIAFDLNGYTLTNDQAITVASKLVITNGVAGQGGLVGDSVITVNNGAVLDMSALTWGAGGFTPDRNGSLAIKNGAIVKMGTTDGLSPNWMAKNNSTFFTDSEEGATLEIGDKSYTLDANGLWILEGGVAKAEITEAGKTFVETFASLADAMAKANDTISLIADTDADGLKVEKNLTLDLNGQELAISTAFTNAAELAIVNHGAATDGLKVAGRIVVESGLLDASALGIGAGGLIQGQPGGLDIANGATFRMMSEWAGASLNWMAANRPTFLTGENGAKVEMSANIYIYSETEKVWILNGQQAKALVASMNDQSQPMEYFETYATLTDAIAAAKAGGTVWPLADLDVGGITVGKQVTLDLNGKTSTIAAGKTLTTAAEVTITNSTPTAGGLVVSGTIAVTSGTLDAFGLTVGTTGGLVPGQAGGLNISGGATFVMMGAWSTGTTPNWMAANRAGFLTGADGAMVEMAIGTYTYNEAEEVWTLESSVAKATIESNDDKGQPMFYTEVFDSVMAAASAAKDGTAAILITDCNSGADTPAKAALVDLNGFTLTNNAAITVSNDLVITNGVANQGGLVGLSVITVNNGATLDMSQLTWGAGGFAPGQSGSLAIAAGAKVMMGTTDGLSPNWMVANNSGFLSACEKGAQLQIGDNNYTKGEDGLWSIDNAVAKTEITAKGKTYEETYATLEAAIAAATEKPVVLIENVTITNTKENVLVIAKTVTIDLNGHDIQRTETKAASFRYFFQVGDVDSGATGNLTIKDSVGGGKLHGSKNYSRSAIRVECGEFTLKSGIIVNNLFANNKDKFNPPCGGAIFVCAGAKATIKDGAIVADNTAGGNTISGVTYDGFGGAFGVEGTLVIEGGTFTNNWAQTDGGVIYGFGNAVIEINGGTFTGNTISNGADEVKSIIALEGNATCAISNGWFDVNPREYVVKGRAPHKDGDLWCIVDAVCEIVDRGYDSLTNAFEEVKNGDRIDMLKPHELGSALSTTNKVTINANGKHLYINQPFTVSKPGVVAVTNSYCNAPEVGTSQGGIVINAEIKVLKGGTIDLSGIPFGVDNYGGIDQGSDDGTLTLASGAVAKFYMWNVEKVDTPNWMFGNYAPFFTDSKLPNGATVYIGKTKWAGKNDGKVPTRFAINGEQAIVTVEAEHNAPGLTGTFRYTESYTTFEKAITEGVVTNGAGYVEVKLTKKVATTKKATAIPGDKLFQVDCGGFDVQLAKRTLALGDVFSGDRHDLFVNAADTSDFAMDAFTCNEAYMFHWNRQKDGLLRLRLAKKCLLLNGEVDGADLTVITADGREITFDQANPYVPYGSDVRIVYKADWKHIFGGTSEQKVVNLGRVTDNVNLTNLKPTAEDRWTRTARKLRLDTRERIVVQNPAELLPIAYSTNAWDEAVAGAPVTVLVTNENRVVENRIIIENEEANGYVEWRMNDGDLGKYVFQANTDYTNLLANVYYTQPFSLTVDQSEGGDVWAITNGVKMTGTFEVLGLEKVLLSATTNDWTWQFGEWHGTNAANEYIDFEQGASSIENSFYMPVTNAFVWARFEVSEAYLTNLTDQITNKYDSVTNAIWELTRLTDDEREGYLGRAGSTLDETVNNIIAQARLTPSNALEQYNIGYEKFEQLQQEAEDRSNLKPYSMVVALELQAIADNGSYDEATGGFTVDGVAYTNGVNAFTSFQVAYAADNAIVPFVTNVVVFGGQVMATEPTHVYGWNLDFRNYTVGLDEILPVVTVAPEGETGLVSITNGLEAILGAEGYIVLGRVEGTEGAADYKAALEALVTDGVKVIYASVEPTREGDDLFIDTYEILPTEEGAVMVPGIYNEAGAINVLDDSDDDAVGVGKLEAEGDIVIVNGVANVMNVVGVETPNNVIVSNLMAQGSIYALNGVVAGQNATVYNCGHLEAVVNATEISLEGVGFGALSSVYLAADTLWLTGEHLITGNVFIDPATAVSNAAQIVWSVCGENHKAFLNDFDLVYTNQLEGAAFGIRVDKEQASGIYVLAQNAESVSGETFTLFPAGDVVHGITVGGPVVFVSGHAYKLYLEEGALKLKVLFASDMAYTNKDGDTVMFDVGSDAMKAALVNATMVMRGSEDAAVTFKALNDSHIEYQNEALGIDSDEIMPAGAEVYIVRDSISGTLVWTALPNGGKMTANHGLIAADELSIFGEGASAELQGEIKASTNASPLQTSLSVPVKIIGALDVGCTNGIPADFYCEQILTFTEAVEFDEGAKITLTPYGVVVSKVQLPAGKIGVIEPEGAKLFKLLEEQVVYGGYTNWEYSCVLQESVELMPLQEHTISAGSLEEAKVYAQSCRVVNTNATEWLTVSGKIGAYQAMFAPTVTTVVEGETYKVVFKFTPEAYADITNALNTAAAVIAKDVMVRRIGAVKIATKPAVFYTVATGAELGSEHPNTWVMGTGDDIEVKFPAALEQKLFYKVEATTDPNRQTPVKKQVTEEE